jgi:hypothetical protein
MPPWAIEQAAGDADGIIERLADLSPYLIGDIEALRRAPDSAEGDGPITEVPTEMAADAIAGTLEAAARHLRRREANVVRLQKQVRRQRAQLAGRGGAVDDLSTRQLARALAGRIKRKAGRPIPERS